jgi:beta-1,4-mannosyl-glycoprotein beta-1,4-N-acetylglucosaminyltransferase
MKIIDLTMFSGEEEMLDFHLKTHSSFVDHTVVVAAKETFSGKPKDPHLEMLERAAKDYPLSVVLIDKYPEAASAWDRETHTRWIAREKGMELAGADGVFMQSDLDEIMDPEVGKRIKDGTIPILELMNASLSFHVYNWKWKLRDRVPWVGIMVLPAVLTSVVTLQWIRSQRGKTKYISGFGPDGDCGWHASYFMTPEQIVGKIKDFSHQEYNKEPYTTLEWVNKRMEEGKDLFEHSPLVDTTDDPNRFLPPNPESALPISLR